MCDIPATPKRPGEYPQEPLPSGWSNVKVLCNNSAGEVIERIEILDLKDQVLYPQEPMRVIAMKCFGLFLFVNPVYFIFYSAVQAVRVVAVPIVNCAPLALFNELTHVVKIPFYFIGMQFAALVGIFQPLDGRALFAKIESDLHDGKGRREAEQYIKKGREVREWLPETFLGENPKSALFVAFCMQPLGRGDSPLIRVELLQNSPAV